MRGANIMLLSTSQTSPSGTIKSCKKHLCSLRPDTGEHSSVTAVGSFTLYLAALRTLGVRDKISRAATLVCQCQCQIDVSVSAVAPATNHVELDSLVLGEDKPVPGWSWVYRTDQTTMKMSGAVVEVFPRTMLTAG